MKNSAQKAEILSALGGRFRPLLNLSDKPPASTISTGAAAVDRLIEGLPRGAITEICGPPSSGRTSLLHSILVEATTQQEACALVDTTDAFDPASGARAGIDLDRLLWVRCAGSTEHALKSVDLLAHGGGFGILALDLGDLSPQNAKRIPLPCWYRLLRTIEHRPTALVILDREPYACGSLVLGMNRERTEWSRILNGVLLRVERRKPGRAATATFQARTAA